MRITSSLKTYSISYVTLAVKNIWLDPYAWSKNTLKSLLKRRLSDIRKYNQYINDNIGKCDVIKTCQNDLNYLFGEREYLDHKYSPYI